MSINEKFKEFIKRKETQMLLFYFHNKLLSDNYLLCKIMDYNHYEVIKAEAVPSSWVQCRKEYKFKMTADLLKSFKHKNL